jgi:hypothetical protein
LSVCYGLEAQALLVDLEGALEDEGVGGGLRWGGRGGRERVSGKRGRVGRGSGRESGEWERESEVWDMKRRQDESGLTATQQGRRELYTAHHATSATTLLLLLYCYSSTALLHYCTTAQLHNCFSTTTVLQICYYSTEIHLLLYSSIVYCSPATTVFLYTVLLLLVHTSPAPLL